MRSSREALRCLREWKKAGSTVMVLLATVGGTDEDLGICMVLEVTEELLILAALGVTPEIKSGICPPREFPLSGAKLKLLTEEKVPQRDSQSFIRVVEIRPKGGGCLVLREV
jgi:hypothetical protein